MTYIIINGYDKCGVFNLKGDGDNVYENKRNARKIVLDASGSCKSSRNFSKAISAV